MHEHYLECIHILAINILVLLCFAASSAAMLRAKAAREQGSVRAAREQRQSTSRSSNGHFGLSTGVVMSISS